jgi:hypothetical protein
MRSFWPYQRAAGDVPNDAADSFVAAVKKLLQERACVQTAFSISDETLARDWFARENLVRYHGILAPSAAWRPLIIPESETSDPLRHSNCPARKQLLAPETGKPQKKRGCRPRNYSWSELMRRVFSIDVLACPRCGGRMRILCAIHPPEAIRKILDCLGLPSRPPPIARAIPEREVDEHD